jgi:phosphate:Na+ symporter
MTMTPLNALIFGLGLFFLGLRLVGENLRRLSGGGFRSVIKQGTHSPVAGGVLGLVAGALMQSATAVTFILVSMTDTGLIKPRAAGPIVIWCNVGLTALAFVATLNIHPLVAFVVGGAGIVLGTIRVPFWQTLAGALLGMGLILIGLEQMGAGAAPLKDAAWFREALNGAVSSAPLAFLAGIAAAALLQSNTGAALLVITFAANGLIGLESAMLLLYGTNLGAIGLRAVLAAGLHGDQLRLVRLEDLFCVLSGVIMITLYGIERAGVPLVMAGLEALPYSTATRLAVVFLISNLLPALLMSVYPKPWIALLGRLWPDRWVADDPARPRFLRPAALDDPSTALDLIARELARLLERVSVPARPVPETGDVAPPSFTQLGLAIEQFAAKLASRGTLNSRQAARLHLLRAQLSIIRHIEEGVRYFAETFHREDGPPQLRDKLNQLLALAGRAAENPEPAVVEELYRLTRLKGGELTRLQKEVSAISLSATALFEDFSMAVWTLHRLAKMLGRASRGE